MFTEPAPSSGELSPRSFEATRLHELSDEALDALPFGVIGLDAAGVVLRYNLYESRLARLDKNAVIGRSFFEQVARCTRGEVFEGRFRALLEAEPGESARFPFIFDFVFGAQQVDIELVRAPGAVVYALVNRVSIAPPRSSFPRELLAARQAELAPDEERWGVRRDARERRVLETPYTFLAALRATCERLAPETWPMFATEWGVQWGRRLAVDLEAESLEIGAMSLGDRTMREVAGSIADQLQSFGFGSVQLDFSWTNEGILVANVTRSALAEAARRSALTPGDRGCHLLAGCLGGVLSSIAGRRLAGREVGCSSDGRDRCELVVVAHERRAAVDRAIANGARTIEAVRAALRTRPGSEGGGG
jgi:photoactive yellow protein